MNEKSEREQIEIQPKGSYFQVDEQGYIINPASPEKVQNEWKPVIADVVNFYKKVYEDKLKNVYIRGSVAKGEAIENISDIDTLVYVDLPTEEISHDWTKSAEETLKEKYPFVQSFELGAYPLADIETKEDQIFLLQSLCVYGNPVEVSKRKPGGDMLFHFPMTEKRMYNFEAKLNKTDSDADIKKGCVWIMKNILRTGFELTMERSKRYTRDLYLCYQSFTEYYPEHEAQMREVLHLALNPSNDKEKILEVVRAIVPWMIEESNKRL